LVCEDVVKAKLVGAKIVIDVIAYELDIGFDICSVLPVVAEPVMYTVTPGVRVGMLAFCEACTGTARGTRNSIPDSASRASIVPELNLLKYI
jgi:hypothetical protein